MALFIERSHSEGADRDVFNQREKRREFTYIDDIVEGILRTLDHRLSPIHRNGRGDRPTATSPRSYASTNRETNQRRVMLSDRIRSLAALAKKDEREEHDNHTAGEGPSTLRPLDDFLH